MELGKQIKNYRDRDGISQEKLAEKIYVSRQSISNWENEKSYPDIHNLLQLSKVFRVSLDELVKGDVDMMKNEVERREMYSWGKIMGISMILSVATIGPAVWLLGLKGLVIPAIFLLMMFVSAVQAERFKQKYNVKTYQEILDYMEGKESVIENKKYNDKRVILRSALFMVGGLMGGAAIGLIIMKLLFA